MNILKRALSTLLNGFLAGITFGILPLVLWLLEKPLVGQMLLGTPDTRGQLNRLVYGLIWFLLCLTLVGFIVAAVWCVLGKEPLALQITNIIVK
ncbi:hypothetical protein [Mesoplasma seiffertii]|uniref:hypothetical protein n=1 Tax=Mesoplasma seiffertii TaxID=28224 RepID=UPI000478CC8C|nr:hypothetical protein [Mesoplasma seiffertii]